jgi:hypothetical protein
MKKRIVTVIALVFAFVAPGVGQVSAASRSPQFYKGASSGAAANSSIGTDTSENWSGYVASGSGYTSVGGEWIVPQATASTSLAADATWVGIGGVASSDLIQAGTQAVIQNGTTTYEAWYELLPAASQEVPLTVKPGDALSVTLAEQSSNVWLISLTDLSSGQNYQTSVTYNSSQSSAEWIEEMPSDQSGLVPLDNFGSVSFSGGFAVQNGARLTISETDASPMTMITSSGAALAVPSMLGVDGASFTVTRSDVASSSSRMPGLPFRRQGSRSSRTDFQVQGYAPRANTSTPTPWRQLTQRNLPDRFFTKSRSGFGFGLQDAFRFEFNR